MKGKNALRDASRHETQVTVPLWEHFLRYGNDTWDSWARNEIKQWVRQSPRALSCCRGAHACWFDVPARAEGDARPRCCSQTRRRPRAHRQVRPRVCARVCECSVPRTHPRCRRRPCRSLARWPQIRRPACASARGAAQAAAVPRSVAAAARARVLCAADARRRRRRGAVAEVDPAQAECLVEDQRQFKRKEAEDYPACPYSAALLLYVQKTAGRVMAQFSYTLPGACEQVLAEAGGATGSSR
jgi:hypothetical protein